MINNQKQWQFLKKSVELGKLPHALLFSGPENAGKRSLAFKLAEFLIGKTKPPDFILIEPQKKDIQISQIRKLIQDLAFKPYLASCKIALIDKAHLMTKEAQNCFLKFLEEPKDNTFLVLITEYPARLLPTILSRVQKIRFYQTKKEDSSPLVPELAKLIKSDLATRFQYAKDLVGQEQDLDRILDLWLRYFRKVLIAKLNNKELSSYSLAKLKDIIKQIQLTKTLLSSTNANSRLALEILLMKL